MRPTVSDSPSPSSPQPLDVGVITPGDAPFDEQWELIRKSQRIQLEAGARYWQAQHAQAKRKIASLERQLVLKEARIKDLRNRLFGKKSEKGKAGTDDGQAAQHGAERRGRGQQPGCPGHGRTPCAGELAVVDEQMPFDPLGHRCPNCGLPPLRKEALDEVCEIKEVQVQAYVRRIRRPAFVPGCRCAVLAAILLPPPVPRLIPRSPYGVSFWVEVLVRKFHYAQPTNRLLADLRGQGMPVSPGTVAGGLQVLAPLFEPLVEALYVRQMNERLFHCDETRWEVFVDLQGKLGSRWYLWVSRSASVIFYILDPSRSAAVPGAHFAGLRSGRVIIVCDRYSAYKKLARLSGMILLAFCWAHVRRDFLDAGRSIAPLEPWALQWKGRIGELYHLNHQRLAHWDPTQPLDAQNGDFQHAHGALAAALEAVHAEAERLALPERKCAAHATDPVPGGAPSEAPTALSRPARDQQRKIAQSLLDHWPGLCRFLDHPEIPMDNNRGEQSIRGPVTARKGYYGSGSLWSAALAATVFSLFQSLDLWGIPVRAWLRDYLQACADNGGLPPADITPFLPWSLAVAPPSSPGPSACPAPDTS
jgi:transposase